MTIKKNTNAKIINIIKIIIIKIIIINIIINNNNKVEGGIINNNKFSQAISISGPSPMSAPFDNTQSPINEYYSNYCSEISSASAFVWYKLDPSSSFRTVSLDTCDSDFDTVLGIFFGDSLADLDPIQCNDDRFSSSSSSSDQTSDQTSSSITDQFLSDQNSNVIMSNILKKECNPTSSLILNITIPSNQTVYILIGGFIDPYTKTPDIGSGLLTLYISDPSTIECSPDLVFTVYEDYQIEISHEITLIRKELNDSFPNKVKDELAQLENEILIKVDQIENDLLDQLNQLENQISIIEPIAQSISSQIDSIENDLMTAGDLISSSSLITSSSNDQLNELSDQSDQSLLLSSTSFSLVDSQFSTLNETFDRILITSNNILSNSSAIDQEKNDVVLLISNFNQTILFPFFDSIENEDLDLLFQSLDQIMIDLSLIENYISNMEGDVDQMKNFDLNSFDHLFDQKNDQIRQGNDQLTSFFDQIENNISIGYSMIEIFNQNLLDEISQVENYFVNLFTNFSNEISPIRGKIQSNNDEISSEFSKLNSKLGELSNQYSSLSFNLKKENNLIENGSANDQSNYSNRLQNQIFVNDIYIFLSDLNEENPPMNLRITADFGGQMDKVADYLNSQYGRLLNQAKMIGGKDDQSCVDDQFCNFFLNSADENYQSQIENYFQAVDQLQFKNAFSYLQNAIFALYPSNY